MQESTKKNYGQLIFLLFEIIAIFTSFICFYKVDLKSKMLLGVLPLGYFLISLLFYKNFGYITNNISKLMVVSLFFVRLVILPFLYAGNIDAQLFEGRNLVESHFSKACLLMVYEYFAVNTALFFYEHKRERRKWHIKHIVSNTDISKGLVICLAIYVLGIAFFLPQYSQSFQTIFSLGDINFTVASSKIEYSVGSLGRVLKTLFSMAVQLFRILFPALLMREAYKRNSNSRACTIWLVLGCALQFMFLTSTFAEAIVACLTLVMFYIKLYPSRKTKTFFFLGASTLGMLVFYFVVRYFVRTVGGLYSKEDGATNYAAQIINAYFTGVDNVAATFNIPSGHGAEAFYAGVIGAIPFNSTLFGNRGNKLQYYYNLYNSAYGQIPPTIGAGYYYFGALLSPAVTVFFIVLSMRYYKKAEKMEASLRYVAVIFCSVTFALGTVMYSPSIALAWYFGWGIPMLVLTLFTGEDRGRQT
mgnify:CR=1 FL=1